MMLGLITDVHEHVENLKLALRRLDEEGVEQVVLIGDVFQIGRHIEETCELLSQHGVVGVWGNHDFGLSNPSPEIRQTTAEPVIDYMTTLMGSYEVDGCFFQHVEPWLNPHDLHELWYFEGPPTDSSMVKRIFDAMPTRLAFGGHYHRWMLVSESGPADWTGAEPIELASPDRYFVVVDALCEGAFACFDTTTHLLRPMTVR